MTTDVDVVAKRYVRCDGEDHVEFSTDDPRSLCYATDHLVEFSRTDDAWTCDVDAWDFVLDSLRSAGVAVEEEVELQ